MMLFSVLWMDCSALANALNRIEQTEDRDILQGHYSSIQQELQVKTDALKSQRQKVKRVCLMLKSKID